MTYSFSLDSGSYESTYHMGSGALAPNNSILPNPEHSTVVTPSYTLSFGDRWLNNGLSITTPGATGANILERGRVQLVPGTCGRSEDTFDNVIPSSPYEAGFIVNISGPVRAIRSSMGANSGQYTVSTDIYYPQREDSTVDLRVHVIPGAMVFNDFATGVTGLHLLRQQHAGRGAHRRASPTRCRARRRRGRWCRARRARWSPPRA